ncbi:MAG: class I SAM-dependent methyltransferase [Candidatus Dormibacteraeota bacterium]|uniref:Class I SAM-dependent methyltransferase n=1 Tax=Candidatus Aeolococcus gillhamiae TaxID=3127015 RepID=A0A934K0U4_9BACT|nr:class I SAM-dependent methyltransferase [Candidatus Dormibacteraeota bacterium]
MANADRTPLSRPYRTAARYYGARAPYSDELRTVLATRLGWDGRGRLLDIGCGPGVIALQLAASFEEVIGLDPEEAMLAEARNATPTEALPKTRWLRGRAEELPSMNLGSLRAVTLGQSFHWMDKYNVAESIYDALEGGGSMLLIHHDSPETEPPLVSQNQSSHPAVPDDAVNNVLIRWLGHGKPPPHPDQEPYSELLARTRFGRPDRLLLPGRPDVVRSVDEVIDNYLSMSFAAPDLFGSRLADFRAELRTVLDNHTETGFFRLWPGNTEILIAVKSVAGQ